MSTLVYLRKYDHATELKADCGVTKVPKERLLFQKELLSIIELLNQGIGTSITNEEVKLLLDRFLSDQKQFCKPCPANQSLIAFSLGLSVKDIIRKLQSLNTLESAAKEIRKSYF